MIPKEKLKAYKKMIDDGNIQDPHATYCIETGVTDIEYDSELPQELLRELMKQISMEMRDE